MADGAKRSSTAAGSRSRQQPGLACDECRARKLRCDRQQPACGLCQDLNVDCTKASTSLPRGPKKGHMRVLQSKINELESRLNQSENDRLQSQAQEQHVQSHESVLGSSSPHDSGTPPENFLCNMAGLTEQDMMALDQPFSDLDFSMDYFMIPTPLEPALDSTMEPPAASISTTGASAIGLPTAPLVSPASSFLTKLMQADLDQMFFDRVHIFVPMLHHKRYVASSRTQTSGMQAFDCLRYAMWTLAASVCSQFQYVQDALYVQAKTSLEALELNMDDDSGHTRQAQAWLLLSMYELKRVSFRKGWISAGRAFRFIQLMKLHEIDMPDGMNDAHDNVDVKNSQLTWVEVEERRKTFWIAYCLDRLVNLQNRFPFTISDHAILTRLPVPEENFQTGRPVKTLFLFEVLGGTDKRKLSPFSNLLVLVTLWGRGVLNRQRRLVDRFYGNEGNSQDFCNRPQWLDTIISQTEQIMPSHNSCDVDSMDSMQLFTSMVAKAIIISLCRAASVSPHENATASVNSGCSNVMNGYEAGVSKAATELVNLAKALDHCGHFSIHPFTPIPLYICADFLQSVSKADAMPNPQAKQILRFLRELASTNVFAQTFVQLLNPASSGAMFMLA